MIRIRQTTDTTVIRRLRAATMPGTAALTADELDNATWWIATSNSSYHRSPIAYGGLCLRGDDLELLSSGVLPAYRGRGIQTRLIRARLRYARACGYTRIQTYAAINNIPSQRALIKCGFQPYRFLRCKDGAAFIHFEKELSPR